jgi:two-component system alkaline phosphatase synthesis response regulator PhoP
MAKILIIEDEPILAEMYRDKFIKSGFEILSAFSAEQGLEMAKKEAPDLILLDILLPRENGVTFLTWLRKEKEIASIPVLVFSNYDDKETKESMFKLEIKDYLIKTNHTPNEIVAKIKQLLSEN